MTHPAMTDPDELDALAAEYVLGTLDAAERNQVAARRQREPALADAIRGWERRLAPLDELVPAQPPPPAVRAAIMKRIAAQATSAAASAGVVNVVQLKQRVARWRRIAVAASAIAASLAGVLVYRETLRAPASTYVAVLQKDAQSPAFLMTVDIEKRTFTVAPVAATKLSGQSYELWIVHDKLGQPKSLGIVGNAGFTVGPQLAGYATSDIREATYAVSLEPEGGSQTGVPGPVVYAGKLVQAKP